MLTTTLSQVEWVGGRVPVSLGFPPKDGCAEGRIRPKPCGETVQSFVADPIEAFGNDGLQEVRK
jgi:hypothetical protein